MSQKGVLARARFVSRNFNCACLNKSRMEKTCNKCGETLPVTAFHRNGSTRDGRHTACKQCRCSYAAIMTDHEAKRQQARRTYGYQKSFIKAQRVLMKMLHGWEEEVDPTLDKTRASRPLNAVVGWAIPEGTVERVAQLLDVHLGPDAYWSGYGRRWRLRCERVPKQSLKSLADPVLYVRELLQPDNIAFEMVAPSAAEIESAGGA